MIKNSVKIEMDIKKPKYSITILGFFIKPDFCRFEEPGAEDFWL